MAVSPEQFSMGQQQRRLPLIWSLAELEPGAQQTGHAVAYRRRDLIPQATFFRLGFSARYSQGKPVSEIT
jgi:hypothetical protein